MVKEDTKASGLPRLVWFALPLVLALGAGGFYYFNFHQSDAELARLEALVEMAKSTCLSNEEAKDGGTAKTSLDMLVKQIKAEGSLEAYRTRHEGASSSLPAELQVQENRRISECMQQYTPAIFKLIGVEVKLGDATPNPIELRFSLTHGEDEAREDSLRLDLQTMHRILHDDNLVVQDAGYYHFPAPYPDEQDKIEGTLVREFRRSTKHQVPGPSYFCLHRPAQLQSSSDPYFQLDCREGATCAQHQPSPHWLEVCAQEQPKSSWNGMFLPAAYAAEPQERWVVPSAKTLARQGDAFHGVGYTVFTIETDALRSGEVIGVETGIDVNGTPILEDALPPAMRPVPNDPTRSFQYTFALEALDFQGIRGGCEAINLVLVPRLDGGRRGTPLKATLPYVALRDSDPATVALTGGGSLTWSASYKIPKDEWSNEVFITSAMFDADSSADALSKARSRAVALKEKFDALGLSYAGSPLVAVIRPPLTKEGHKLAYGIAAGLLDKASGRVRFTFPIDEAQALARNLLSVRQDRAEARSIIDPGKYLYRVAGNEKRRKTPNPPGICGNLSGATGS